MLSNNLFKHNIGQLFTTAGIAVLIYTYAVAQGFTLPMTFQSKPTKILSQADPKPTHSKSSEPTAKQTPTSTPHANSQPSTRNSFILSEAEGQLSIPTPTSSLPGPATEHASEVAQEVANVPNHALERTEEVLTNISTKALDAVTDKLLK